MKLVFHVILEVIVFPIVLYCLYMTIVPGLSKDHVPLSVYFQDQSLIVYVVVGGVAAFVSYCNLIIIDEKLNEKLCEVKA